MRCAIKLVCILFCSGLVACKSGEKKEPEKEKHSGAVMLQKAMEQEFMWTRDPQLNSIPKERLLTALAYTRNLENSLAGRTNALAWQERGPSNVGGRTRA